MRHCCEPRLYRAREGHLLELVYKALDERGLPRELALMPLQESDYDIASVGPPTPHGISKGMWGFIPELRRGTVWPWAPFTTRRSTTPWTNGTTLCVQPTPR